MSETAERTKRETEPMSDALRARPVERRERSVSRANESLTDVPYVLYCAREGARLMWTLVCKRYPELREW